MNLFIEWIKEIVKENGGFVAIDGKAIRSATDKINNGNIPYIVSTFLTDIWVSVGQVKVDDKSNEITAIPELLDLLNIKGKIVTIDAIGTQENIINKIVEKGASFALKVKNNQSNLLDDIKIYFELENSRENLEIAYYETNY